MTGGRYENLDDAKTINKLSEIKLWTSPWYRVSDFVIAYYVTIFSVATAYFADLSLSYCAVFLIVSIVYDLTWQKHRIPIVRDKNGFIQYTVVNFSGDLDHKHRYRITAIAHLGGTIAAQVAIVLYAGNPIENYQAILIILNGFVFALSEYALQNYGVPILRNTVSAHLRYCAGLENPAWNLMKLVSQSRAFSIGSEWHQNKFFSSAIMLFLILTYCSLVDFLFSEKQGIDVLKDGPFYAFGAILTLSATFLAILFISAIRIRAIEVARCYVQLFKGC